MRPMLAFAVMALLVCAVGCNQAEKTGTTASMVVVANDGHSQIALPNDWQVKSEPPVGVRLSAVSNKDALGLAINTTAKAEAVPKGATLREYAVKWTSFLVRNKAEVTMNSGEDLSIDGRPALKYKITFREPNSAASICMIHVTVEGKKHYHELMFSMLKSKYDELRPKIEAILTTFQDLP